ncbi:hypothetical protein DFH08DRAFT_783889 [Mycena albidolilacea]|uniref:SMP-30/Gluconolactonase/LRE-like region domain-containing protein n=1 Tax=Mycena albidolilacea TaxID=1033008 RepID=A0AAD7ELP9_9AGAR|nr:hypothetical protein DFH08DRAFT_783889 [Mycena albidolilacea]
MIQVGFILSIVATVIATFPTTLVYQSPTGLFLENIAVRPCSKLLLTSALSPALHMLDPSSANTTFDEVYSFPNASALFGIIEYQPDVYAVVTANAQSILQTHRVNPGSIAIWRVDFRLKTPIVTPIAGIPQSTLINGLSSVPGHPDLVLAADSGLGAVYEITMSTGAVRIAIQDAAMAPGAPAPALGINGLHIHGSALYFTNSQQGTFARIPIAVQSKGVSKAGAVLVLSTVEPPGLPHRYDDFTFDADGRAWVTAHPGALTLLYPLTNGTWAQENAAGDPEGSYAVFMEPTSATFGRGVNKKILYVTTEGGQVVSVDASGK